MHVGDGIGSASLARFHDVVHGLSDSALRKLSCPDRISMLQQGGFADLDNWAIVLVSCGTCIVLSGHLRWCQCQNIAL